MEDCINITRERLCEILDLAKGSLVSLNLCGLMFGIVFFENFDYDICEDESGEVLYLSSEELEDSWKFYLNDVKLYITEDDIITYEDLLDKILFIDFDNGLHIQIEF